MSSFKRIQFEDAEPPVALQMLTTSGDRIDIAFSAGSDPAELLFQLISGMPPNEPQLLRQPQSRALQHPTRR